MPMNQTSQVVGAMLGLALGDASGAPYEGGWLERSVWRLIGKTKDGLLRYTDDTQMALDLARSLIEHGGFVADACAARFATSYKWSRGYGPGAAKTLKLIRRGVHWNQANRVLYPQGSLGNGAAMRSPIIGLWCIARPNQLVELAHAAAVLTHAHPLGIEGAVLIAIATRLAVLQAPTAEMVDALQRQIQHHEFRERLDLARALLNESELRPEVICAKLGHGIHATDSCITAIYLALRYADEPIMKMLECARRLGGDVDTISAMAGALWGARRGADELPQQLLAQLEDRPHIEAVAMELYAAAPRADDKASFSNKF